MDQNFELPSEEINALHDEFEVNCKKLMESYGINHEELKQEIPVLVMLRALGIFEFLESGCSSDYLAKLEARSEEINDNILLSDAYNWVTGENTRKLLVAFAQTMVTGLSFGYDFAKPDLKALYADYLDALSGLHVNDDEEFIRLLIGTISDCNAFVAKAASAAGEDFSQVLSQLSLESSIAIEAAMKEPDGGVKTLTGLVAQVVVAFFHEGGYYMIVMNGDVSVPLSAEATEAMDVVIELTLDKAMSHCIQQSIIQQIGQLSADKFQKELDFIIEAANSKASNILLS